MFFFTNLSLLTNTTTRNTSNKWVYKYRERERGIPRLGESALILFFTTAHRVWWPRYRATLSPALTLQTPCHVSRLTRLRRTRAGQSGAWGRHTSPVLTCVAPSPVVSLSQIYALPFFLTLSTALHFLTVCSVELTIVPRRRAWEPGQQLLTITLGRPCGELGVVPASERCVARIV